MLRVSNKGYISCGYTYVLPTVSQGEIGLGWDQHGSPVTLQNIARGECLTSLCLAGNLMHHGDRKPRDVWSPFSRSFSYTAISG